MAVRVRVPSSAPNQYNPNLFPIGEGVDPVAAAADRCVPVVAFFPGSGLGSDSAVAIALEYGALLGQYLALFPGADAHALYGSAGCSIIINS